MPNTVQPPLLNQHGLVINTKLNILICVRCQGIINPAEIRNHFLLYHKGFTTALDLQARFDKEVRKKYPELTNTPAHPLDRIECIYGLAPPESGYLLCSACSHCYSSKKTFDKHHCTSTAGSHWTLSFAQRFIDNNTSPWFPVHDPKPSLPPRCDPWTLYEAQSQERTRDITTAALSGDYRVLHQFLRKQCWFDQLGDQQHNDLIPLVSYSNRDEIYGTLHKDIHAFLANTQASLKSYSLRRLVSTRPAEERDQTRISHHRDVNPGTHDNYARIIASLIAFIHRVVSNDNLPYTFPITPDIASACQNLINTLSPPSVNASEEEKTHQLDEEFEMGPASDDADSGDDDDDDSEAENDGADRDSHPHALPKPRTATRSTPALQRKLSRLLYLLFTQEPSGELQGDFFSPISHYVLLASLRKDQQWAAAGTITHYIAAILFTGRLVFAHRVMYLAGKSKQSYSRWVRVV